MNTKTNKGFQYLLIILTTILFTICTLSLINGYYINKEIKNNKLEVTDTLAYATDDIVYTTVEPLQEVTVSVDLLHDLLQLKLDKALEEADISEPFMNELKHDIEVYVDNNTVGYISRHNELDELQATDTNYQMMDKLMDFFNLKYEQGYRSGRIN